LDKQLLYVAPLTSACFISSRDGHAYLLDDDGDQNEEVRAELQQPATGDGTPTGPAETSTDGVDHHNEPQPGTAKTTNDGQNALGHAPVDGGEKLKQPAGNSDEEDDL
jgi:hypothetical protein